MKTFTSWCLAAMFASAGGVGAAENLAPERGGVLYLWQENGTGRECQIDILPGKHSYYMGDTNCHQDVVSYFKLQDMQSAVWILFGSENHDGDILPRCPFLTNIEGWRERVKTVKNPITSEIISLEDLGKARVDVLFKPGILKDYSRDDGGVSHEGKLSCVTTVWCPADVEGTCDGSPPH